MANEYEHEEGKGNIFVNSYKEKPTQPDRKGSFKFEGEVLEIAGWIATNKDGKPKKDKNGNPILNIQVRRPYEGGSSKVEEPKEINLDEDIPF